MNSSVPESDYRSVSTAALLDPREGDIEDDATSPGQRSLLAMAGSLLVEISLPKLLFAGTISVLVPALLLGLAPLLASVWLRTVSEHVLAITEISAVLVLIVIVALGWFGWHPVFRMVEASFWALNAIAVQPGYAFSREALRHAVELIAGKGGSAARRTRLRAACSLGAGLLVCAFAALIAFVVWPSSRWTGQLDDLAAPHHLIVPTLANAVVVVCCYLAVASLVWGLADSGMDQPLDLEAFDAVGSTSCTWRVAHLSDLHVVGERYGFRIESGRSGRQGNEQLARTIARLAAIHAADPLDYIIISGDMTDAGRAAEWAEFLELLQRYPELAVRSVILPGNHDLNIVDRANPARLDLPFSPGKRLRQMRCLSAMEMLQGARACVLASNGLVMGTLNEVLAPHRRQIQAFGDRGGLRRGAELRGIFDDLFPMLLFPVQEDGLGVAILNSNADTHFSFTNALGLVSARQARRLESAMARYPKTRWIVALHHHLIEYPMPAASFSERIGTALVNGSWVVRRLQAFADRAIVMHGHRHIDWIGCCGPLKIISAPSPVMTPGGDGTSYFYIHHLATGADGQLRLLAPEHVEVAGELP